MISNEDQKHEDGVITQELGDLHVSSGPMTRARARSIQQAMGSLIVAHKDLKGLGEFIELLGT